MDLDGGKSGSIPTPLAPYCRHITGHWRFLKKLGIQYVTKREN